MPFHGPEETCGWFGGGKSLRSRIDIEGDGQECLSHTIEGQGLKPAWIVRLYAALKRRSSTLLLAPLAIDPSKSQGLKPASLLALGGAA